MIRDQKRNSLSFWIAVILLCPLFTSCGYRFNAGDSLYHGKTISVPYVKGDTTDGQLTIALIQALGDSGEFTYVHAGGNLILKVSIIHDEKEKIGYRYDRHAISGKLEKNLVPTEGRRVIKAEVSLLDGVSEQTMMGPVIVFASAEYDYVDSDNLHDLSFITEQGFRETVLNFSLGQLDSIEGAEDNALDPLYRRLAQKIVDGLVQ